MASAALVAENERFGRARQVRHASLGASSSSTAVKEMKQEGGGNERRGGFRGRNEAGRLNRQRGGSGPVFRCSS